MQTNSESGSDSIDLPHPREDPDIRYLHEGKQYTTFEGRKFEIVRWDRDGPAGGVVVLDWVNTEGHPLHEHQQDNGGITEQALEPYIEEYGDNGGVVTGNHILRSVRNLRIGEVDPNSYADIFYAD